jgi:hypothetical protein
MGKILMSTYLKADLEFGGLATHLESSSECFLVC